jgi:hypothetical protein
MANLQKSIRTATIHFFRNEKQTESIHHITHCLDALRRDTLCYADDTPRYSTLSSVNLSGVGQVRQCKDWSRLESWAEENTACFRNWNSSSSTEVRYSHCPKGSEYEKKVKEYFAGGGE